MHGVNILFAACIEPRGREKRSYKDFITPGKVDVLSLFGNSDPSHFFCGGSFHTCKREESKPFMRELYQFSGLEASRTSGLQWLGLSSGLFNTAILCIF